MSDARERILARIRRARGESPGITAEAVETARRMAYADTPGPLPTWDGDAVTRFLERHQGWSGTWQRLTGHGDIPAAVETLLAGHGATGRLLVAPHPLLEALDWPETLERNTIPDSDCAMAVSVAETAIAETGTLVLCSGPASPTRLDFLPEHHVVVLRATDIVDYMEAVWPLLRSRDAFPPRSLNFISGPSRTADVEQTIQLGAHGPRSVHILLLQE